MTGCDIFLTSPSGGAAEDTVEERENSEVTQFLVTGYVLRTDGRTDGRMDRETCQLKYYFRCLFIRYLRVVEM